MKVAWLLCLLSLLLFVGCCAPSRVATPVPTFVLPSPRPSLEPATITSSPPTPSPAAPVPQTPYPPPKRSPQVGYPLPTEIPSPTPPQLVLARVETLTVWIDEGAAPRAWATVRGHLANGCTRLTGIKQSVGAQEISLHLMVQRLEGMACTQALVPFVKTVPLDLRGLEPGIIRVRVDKLTETLAIDEATISASMPEHICRPPSEGQERYLDERGFCFLYPQDYELWRVSTDSLLLAPSAEVMQSETITATLLIQIDGLAQGLTAEEIARSEFDKLVQTKIISSPKLVRIAGTPAVMLEGLPGRASKRLAILVHQARIYRLWLEPIDPQYPEASERAESLWDLVTGSLTFYGF